MDKNSEELASDELDLFDDIKEEYLKNPDAFLEKDLRKKEKCWVLAVGLEKYSLPQPFFPLFGVL